MKKKILYTATCGIILAAAVFGIIKRQSYTDITKDDAYLESIQIAVLPEKMTFTACGEMEKSLPEVPITAQVEVIGEIEHLFTVSRQKVKIKKIYKGKGLQNGDEIYVHSDHWSMSLSQGPKSMERGFINILRKEKKYLVFLVGKTEDLYSEIPVYKLYDNTLIAPVFCYEEIKNKPVQAGEEHTYISYTRVRENEFFGETEEAVKCWLQLKEKMLALYPE